MIERSLTITLKWQGVNPPRDVVAGIVEQAVNGAHGLVDELTDNGVEFDDIFGEALVDGNVQ